MKVGGQKVRYVTWNQGNQTFLAGYPGILLGYQDDGKGGFGFKGGSLHDGFGGFDGSGERLAPLLLVLQIQCQETVLSLLTVLAVSAVVAVSVVTATPLKLNPPFSSSWGYPGGARKVWEKTSCVFNFWPLILGIVLGLGGTRWVAKICLCLGFVSFLVGEKHINKIPPKVPGQSPQDTQPPLTPRQGLDYRGRVPDASL